MRPNIDPTGNVPVERVMVVAVKSVMVESAELQNQIYSQVTDEFLRSQAEALGLTEEKHPTYFELQKKWLFASQ